MTQRLFTISLALIYSLGSYVTMPVDLEGLSPS